MSTLFMTRAYSFVGLCTAFFAFGCGSPAPDAECEKAKAKADTCMSILPANADCPNEGDADPFQECIYPCFSNVGDCAEFSDSMSDHFKCIQACVDEHGEDPP